MTNKNAPHYVYRAFDSYGLLLYIGCSLDVPRRMKDHRRESQWHHYAETVSITGPWGYEQARLNETRAIESEGSYFNCTKGDAERRRANNNAAKHTLYRHNDYRPLFDFQRWEAEGESYYGPYEVLSSAWDGRRDRVEQHLKATTHPYLTPADRMARYLAAREDAESARTERAA